MKSHDWLLDVLRDVETYAMANAFHWLVPLINRVNVAASRELKNSSHAAIDLSKTNQVLK